MNREDFENEIEIEEAENELYNESELTDAELVEDEAEENSLIPAYTKADFLTGFEPFEWIYQSKDNKLQYAQRIELMKAKAKEVGISSFKSLWKAYLDTVQMVSSTSYDNVTEFSGQPFHLNCGSWQADDYGVYGRNMFDGEVEACNHPIMPIRRLKNIETDTEKIVLAFCKRGEQWRTITVDRKTISSTNSIIALADYGIAVNSENARNLIKYLAEVENRNLDVLPLQKSVSRLGFIGKHGFSPYSEGLVFDAADAYRDMYNSVAPAGDFEKWKEVINDAREKNVVTRLYIAASFASVLVGMSNGLTFFVHLWGGTEAGKTVALMAAASVWANPAMGKYIHSFNSTAVGHELTAAFVNSLPLGIDELQILDGRNKFDELIYMLAEGVGRKRANKNAEMRSAPEWHNCILTTGEKPITNGSSGGGAINRIIEVDCKHKKLIEKPVEFLEIIRNNYGHAGKIFVEHLLTDKGKELAEKLQKINQMNLLADGDITDKQALSASFILTADGLANEWIFKSRAVLSLQDIKPYLATKRSVSMPVRALDFLYNQIGVNIKKFKHDSDYNGEVWGTIDDEYIYINKSVFDKMLEDNGYSSVAFLSWAKENKVIDYEYGRNTMRKTINGVQVYCVWIRKDKFDMAISKPKKDSLPF